MHKDEAKLRVAEAWHDWQEQNVPPGDRASYAHGLGFFAHLQNKQPELLDFEYSGSDKWQIVHAWLLQAGYVSD